MLYLNDYLRVKPYWTALVKLPDNVIPKTKIRNLPFMIISEATVLSSSSPRRARLKLAGLNNSIVVNPIGKYSYIAANADEIVSLYIARLAAKKTFKPTDAARLSEFLKLTLAVEGIA